MEIGIRTKLFVMAAVVLLVYVILGAPSRDVPAPSTDSTPASEVLRLATSNLYALNPHPRATSLRLVETRADVLVLLEVTAYNFDRELLERAGYVAVLDRHAGLQLGFGAAVYVREGREARVGFVPSPVQGSCQPGVAALRLAVAGSHVALLGVHFAPPGCTAVTGSALDACATWIGEGRLTRAVGPCRVGDPVVVLGDFNVVPYGGGWGSLERAGLRDAWDVLHTRPGPTWAQPFGFPSLLRIDAILAPGSWDVLGSWTLDLEGSDHDIVVADVRVC